MSFYFKLQQLKLLLYSRMPDAGVIAVCRFYITANITMSDK